MCINVYVLCSIYVPLHVTEINVANDPDIDTQEENAEYCGA